MGDTPKRRLPVLPSSGDGEETEDRPPWHWTAIGLVAIFLVWLPLAAAGSALVARTLRASGLQEGEPIPARLAFAMVAVMALGFVVASGAGGYLVGRFGGRAGTKEAASSGFVAALVAWSIALAEARGPSGSIALWLAMLIVLGALGTGAAFAGGRLGVRNRRP